MPLERATMEISRALYTQDSKLRRRDKVTRELTVPIGKGLFSKFMYKRDDPIVSFSGTLRTQKAFTNLCEKEPWRRAYALVFSEHGEVMDCFDQYQKGLCLASYSNSPSGCFDITTSKKAVENCRLVLNVKEKTMTLKCGVNKESN